ncbi:LacI family DNA-binding transcriptional regulator [Allorhizobium sp. BGMRC 0089]|uniref:LacI family DNA-binding transcriptional regulator n=1 Tax=Allorhizobium sonneratiae TaxID=2934936 RepID=UPI002033E373|nr:LacI family DNA-binding transcriptional regulator [Allorhizobium sonneratiae]MCM2293778.1 LacI family DNA-binding transcriptional regulator [Allorhizobium sonneratiae]
MTENSGQQEQAARRLREGSGRAKLEEVAHLAGVSTATVSRAYNMPEKVSLQTREKIFAAAKSVGWVPNAAGRALASNRSHIAGVIIPTLDNEIFSHQVGAMQRVFAEHGLNLLIACSNYNPDLGLQQAMAMIERGVEAMALAGETHPPALYEHLERLAIPYVLTYAYRPGADHAMVGFDNEAAFARMTNHLIELGHRRFAVVMQPKDDNDRVEARLRGIEKALASAGLSLDGQSMMIGKASLDFGMDCAGRLAALPVPSRPTAIICGNDTLALGVQMGIARAGYQVPEDFSVTGFDDLELSSRIRPALTTMFVDNRQIGRIAAEQLVTCLTGKSDRPQSHEVAVSLRLRESTAAPAQEP